MLFLALKQCSIVVRQEVSSDAPCWSISNEAMPNGLSSSVFVGLLGNPFPLSGRPRNFRLLNELLTCKYIRKNTKNSL